MTDPSPTSTPGQPKNPRRRRFLRRLFFGGLIVLPPTAVYARLYEPDHLRVARVDVPIAGLPAEADGLRIGHISDPHCDSRHAMMRAARAAHLLMGEKPDVVFMTGDYVTTKPGECIPYMAKMLRPLAAAPRGSYAVLGNHDWWAGDPDGVEKQLTQTGFTVLRNRSVPLKGIKDVWIVGLDQRCNGHQNVNKALHGVPAGATKLLLIHEPDYADEAPEGFALQFSGHLDNGIKHFDRRLTFEIVCSRPGFVATKSVLGGSGKVTVVAIG